MLINMLLKNFYQGTGSFQKHIITYIVEKPDEKKADDGKKEDKEGSSFNGKFLIKICTMYILQDFFLITIKAIASFHK